MKKSANARIKWLSPEAGGRKEPPAGPIYSTVVHFEDDTTNWPETAWSLVVELKEPPDKSLESSATIWFLAHNHPETPDHFLRPGGRFELFEGNKLVAKGKILDQ